MLQTVTIKNFRSLRDVTLNLQKVNLLIGPNNSGKTNFLKALAFLKEHYNQRIRPDLIDFNRLFFKQNFDGTFLQENNMIVMGFRWSYPAENAIPNSFYQLELAGFHGSNLVYVEGQGVSLGSLPTNRFMKEIDNILKESIETYVLFADNSFFYRKKNSQDFLDDFNSWKKGREIRSIIFSNGKKENRFKEYNNLDGRFLRHEPLLEHFSGVSLTNLFNTIKIYRPDPAKITKENQLLFDKSVNEDCSNLVSFLDNMRDGHDAVWQAIQKDLQKCIPDFQGISFEKVQINGKESLGKRFGLRDREGKVYWAEELSEGTIYFLALLAIVHQPDPPKVLLLEEPEKGIHPRRIAEVMDLIFRLAEEKDIQIIMTSHSTQVVDAFQDIPESVFVFDMIDGETKVKNLLTDILEPDAKDAETKNFPPIDYSKRSLSEHWATGLLGGVPH